MRYRSGIGYDVHQFAEGRPLILGGVEIPHTHGLAGHSDADVLSHAIADAILGAIGEPDIGYWFPPTDDSIEGISSLKILEKAAELVAEKGGRIENIDSSDGRKESQPWRLRRLRFQIGTDHRMATSAFRMMTGSISS